MKMTLVLLAAVFIAASAYADNAVPIATRDVGGTQFLLFSHGSPLRAGLTSLSVMAIDSASGNPRSGWQVKGSMVAVAIDDESGNAWFPASCHPGTRADSEGGIPLEFMPSRNGNVFAKDVSTVIPKPGTWRMDARFHLSDGNPVEVRFPIEVVAPLPPLFQYWPWFAVLPFAVGSYFWSQKR